MVRVISLILATLLAFEYQNSCAADDGAKHSHITKFFGLVGNVVEFGTSVYTNSRDLYSMLQPKTTKESESDKKLSDGMEKRVTEQIKQISKKLEFLKVDMKDMKNEIIDKIANQLPEQLSLRNNLFEIYLRINQIENLYENFENYIKYPRNFHNETLMDFARTVTSHDLNALPNVLKTMHWMLVQTDVNAGDSILTILSRNTQSPSQMCKTRKSLQQMLYDLYNTVVIADIKGYAMVQFANSILQLENNDDLDGEIKLAEHQFVNRIKTTLKTVKQAMASACRAVWKCDNYEHQEDRTYTKLNNLFQKFIINEVDINMDRTCTKTCPDYKQAATWGCYDEKICTRQRECQGYLWHCEYKIDTTMWVCPSDTNSTRRYEYIEYGNGQRYGLKGNCKSPSTKLKSWIRGMVQCSYCMCTCDDFNSKESDRYINLRTVHVTPKSNYVVTGIRLRKSNHIIHIQIQQAKLLPGGLVNASTVHWKPIEDYELHKPIPSTEGNLYEHIPQENQDYHILEYKNRYWRTHENKGTLTKAAVNLDDLDFGGHKLGSDYLVTAMKFSVNNVYGSGKHVNLEVQMSKFDFATGKLNLEESVWYSTYKSLNGREGLVVKSDKTQVNLDNLNVPLISGAPAVPTSQTNQYFYFTTSSLETDAGQTTVPFIDLQPVETNPPTPLSGAGLFLKSSQGSAGFLSVKLFTYNYEPFLDVEETY